MNVCVTFVVVVAFALTFFNEDDPTVVYQPVGFASTYPNQTISIYFTGGINNNTAIFTNINKRYNITGGWIMRREDLLDAEPILISFLKQGLVAPYFTKSSIGVAGEFSEVQHFFQQHGHSISVAFYDDEEVRDILREKCNVTQVKYWVPSGDFNHTPTTLNWYVFDYLKNHNLSGPVAFNQTWLAVEYYEEFLHDLARFKFSVIHPIDVEYK